MQSLVIAVDVRTRAAGTGRWSDWLRLDGDARADETARRGGTGPAWAGFSDGADIRIHADMDSSLPAGLGLALIDHGQSQTGAVDLARLPLATVQAAPGTPSLSPKPSIVSRTGWGADESISPAAPVYLPRGKTKAVVVHHTAESNTYACADAPAVVRAIFAYHVQQLGWRDIGYNFLVDKCSTVYEGRTGG
ncbi:N-acetylmuramoyl-L-alanine amidase [Streptomyces prunicolor]|uniref:N-acetylmuramoyl-L-alanine amidase n=1 Tax=Streptomyces prunicolor TaxID=67348 RepID=UPI001FE134A3|nr:N-acetylmuramoyl-L-alanine amidase [Streptomyces prunicolor]